MRFTSLLTLLLAVPATFQVVQACEGECIVGITNAFLGNYSLPLEQVTTSLVKQVSALLPGQPSYQTTMDLLTPLFDAYHHSAYPNMETAIFPHYFHGKCLDARGSTPPGCPNPDCPIVCGTPGSLVHFYPKLRYIAYNATRQLIQDLVAPGSDTYKQLEAKVVRAAQNHHTRDLNPTSTPSRRVREPDAVHERRARIMSRVFAFARAVQEARAEKEKESKHSGSEKHHSKSAGSHSGSGSGSAAGLGSGSGSPTNSFRTASKALSGSRSGMVVPVFLHKRTEDVKSGLRNIMQQIGVLLEEVCGGSGDGVSNGLPRCSWEKEMKKYILTFP